MPSGAEVLGNGAIRGQEALGMLCGLEPLHAILALSCGTMRILTAVVQITTLPVFHARQDLTLRRAVAFELIRADHPWHIGEAFEQLAKELLGCLLIAAALYQNIQIPPDLVVKTQVLDIAEIIL